MYRPAESPNLNDSPFPTDLSRLLRVHLEITQGQAKVKMRPVRAPVFLIGRATDCDLVLGDPQFPDVHMYLFLTADGVSVRHLDEGPGVKVNGQPVSSIELHDDDRIVTGPYEFRIHVTPPDEHREQWQRITFESEKEFDRNSSNECVNVVVRLVKEIRQQVLNEPIERRRA